MGTQSIAVLAAAILAAAFLVACGGSDSTQQSGSQPNQGDGGSKEGSGDSRSAAVATPLKVSGGGSEQFRSKGGDNSIQEFGEESDESELEEAAEALHDFYVARAEESWAKACTYLSKSMTEQLEQLSAQAPNLEGKGCPAILHAFTRPLPSAAARETTVVDAGSLRTEGEQSFLIYYGEGKVAYAMPMKQEEDGWKVTLLSATPLG